MRDPLRRSAYRTVTAHVVDAGDDAEFLASELAPQLLVDIREGRFSIPPFPKVAAELNAIASSPAPDVQRAGRLIQRDAQLAGRVIKAACSPMFGGRAVTTLQEASVRLGMNGLRDVALAATMGQMFPRGPLMDMARSITRHSFVVAALTNKACRFAKVERQQGFLCGLFHDIGRLVLTIALTNYGKQDPRYVDPVIAEQLSSELHERVGHLVLSRWGLHSVVKDVAAHHHNPSRASADARPYAVLVAVMDAIDRSEQTDPEQRLQELMTNRLSGESGLGYDELLDLSATVDTARNDEVLMSIVGY